MIRRPGAKASTGREWDECAAVGRLDIAGWWSSGVLIHPRIVLTAAHSGPLGQMAVPRAVILRARDLFDIAAAEIVEGQFTAHARYLGKGAFDVAVMILNRESSVEPVAMASTEEIACAREVTMAGFGADREARIGLRIRRAVTVPIAFFASGVGRLPRKFSHIRFDPSREFLAGAADCGPSFGDSGGPVYIHVEGRRKLAGIISRPATRLAPYCRGLAILTRIDVFRPWIRRLVTLTGRATAAASPTAHSPFRGQGSLCG